MSNAIENKIVSMQFDNSKFNSNVDESINSINKLKGSLNFDANSFNGIENAASKISFANMAEETERSSNIMSYAIQKITDGALYSLGRRVEEVTNQIITMFSTKPISDGFAEYELKMGSVQTIMASTGASVEEVNGYLDELNEYSDRTIYSFSDMTNNIGKFTNAGVSLQDAVLAIKGISNEAALSGANAQEASRAMYNFSQALSAGYVKLIDWKSIENANMATVGFKEELIKTAVEVGTLTEGVDGLYNVTDVVTGSAASALNATHNFNDSLANQWMTTEVLTKTLAKYSDETGELGQRAYAAAQDIKTFSQLIDTLKESAGSGWAQTWEILFGNFEEAKVLWTQINNIISPIIDGANDARNALLQGWKDLGGRQDIIDSLMNIVEALKSLIKPIKEAFTEIFPPVTAQQLKNISGGLKELTSHLILSSSSAEILKNVFKGLFSVIKALGDAIGFVFKMLSPILGLVGKILSVIGSIVHGLLSLVTGVANTATGLGKAKDSFDEFGKSAGVAGSIINKVVGFIGNLVDAIGGLVKQIKNNIAEAGGGIKGIFVSIFDALFSAIEKVTGVDLDPIKNKIVNFMKTVAGAVTEFLGPALPVLRDFVGAVGKNLLDFIKKLTDTLAESPLVATTGLLEVGALSKIILEIKNLLGIGNQISSTGSAIGDAIKGVGGFSASMASLTNNINTIFNTLNTNLKQTQENIKSKTIKNIAESIALLAASLFVLGQLDAGQIAISLGAITVALAELMGAMSIMNGMSTSSSSSNGVVDGVLKLEKTKSTGINKVGIAMIELAAAIDLMAGALAGLAKYDMNQIAVGLTAMTVILTEMVTVAKLIQSLNIKSFNSVAVSMILLGKAVDSATDPVIKLASLDIEKAIQGVVGIGAVMAELVGMSAAIKQIGGMNISQGIGLELIAGSISKVSDAMYKLASIDVDKLLQGIGGVAGAMGVLILTANSLSQELSAKASFGLIMVAESIKIMADAFGEFGKMSIDQIAMGFVSLTGAMVLLVATTDLIQGNLVSTGAGLIVCGLGLQTMASAINAMGNIDIVVLANGLLGIGGALVTLGLGMRVMQTNIGGAASLAIASVGLIALAKAVQMFGSMDLGKFGKAMLMIAGALVELGIAMYAMTGAIVGAAALAIVSVGLLALAAALAVMSAIPDPGGLLITVAGALIVFGTVAAVMGMAAAPMIAFAAAITILAASMLLIVGVVAVFALAINLLATSMAIFSEGLELVAKVVNENLLALTEANAFFLEFAATGLLAAAGLILLGAGAIVAGAGIAILAGASALIGMTGKQLNDFLKDLVENCSHFDKILEAAAGLLTLGAALSAFALETMGLVATSVGISKFSSAVTPLLQSLVAYANASDRMAGASMNMIKYGEAGADVAKYIADTLKSHVDTFNAGAAAFFALANGINNTCKSILLLSLAVERFNSDCQTTNELGQMFIDIFKFMSETVGNLAESLSGNMNKVAEAFNNFATQMQAILVVFFKAMMESVTNNVNAMVEFIVNALHSDTLKMGLYTDGQYMIDGFREGIESKAMEVAYAAMKVAQSVDSTVRQTLDIHSPSRVFRAIGEYVDLGFAQGIDNYADKVTNSASNVANGVVTNVGKALDNIPSLDSDIDINPVISPVLDMSNIRNGAQGIAAMLESQNVSLNANIDRLSGLRNIGTINTDDSQSKIYSEMQSMNRSISDLSSAVMQLAAGDNNITVPVYIGNDRLDTVFVKAQQRINLRSGGR